MEPYTLLIVARSQSFAKRLAEALDTEQYLVRWVSSTSQALDLDLEPSLLVHELPSSGGSRSTSRLKHRFGAPLLAISRQGQAVPNHIDGTICRPCQVQDLVDLIETTLLAHSPHLVQAGGMSLDTETRRLQIDGELIQLRPLGSRILALLIAQAGEVVSRDELTRRVWGIDGGDDSRVLDVHIARLRRQIEADPRHPKVILTERGTGYRLQPPGAP